MSVNTNIVEVQNVWFVPCKFARHTESRVPAKVFFWLACLSSEVSAQQNVLRWKECSCENVVA